MKQRTTYRGRSMSSRDNELLMDRKPSMTQLASFVGPVVYAVRLEDGGVIKIGYTAHIYNRASAYGGLRTIIALIPGTKADEQAIHAGLKDHRHHGREYYNPTPEVLAVVNDMRARFDMAPITA